MAATEPDSPPEAKPKKKVAPRAKSFFERMGFVQDKRDITPKQFDYIYRNKVKDKLDKRGEMQFHEVNLLLGAYEYYRYEKKSKKTLQSLEQAE